MTDDIVTRLRLLSASQKAHRFGDLMEDWSGEAADEIERLRADSDQLWFWVVHLREGSTWCGQREKICDVCQIYEETLSND